MRKRPSTLCGTARTLCGRGTEHAVCDMWPPWPQIGNAKWARSMSQHSILQKRWWHGRAPITTKIAGGQSGCKDFPQARRPERFRFYRRETEEREACGESRCRAGHRSKEWCHRAPPVGWVEGRWNSTSSRCRAASSAPGGRRRRGGERFLSFLVKEHTHSTTWVETWHATWVCLHASPQIPGPNKTIKTHSPIDVHRYQKGRALKELELISAPHLGDGLGGEQGKICWGKEAQ